MRALAGFPLLDAEVRDKQAQTVGKLNVLRNEIYWMEGETELWSGLIAGDFETMTYSRETRDRVKKFLS